MPPRKKPRRRPPPPDRESIWTVSARWKAVYFPLFTALTIIGSGYITWHGITHRPQGDIHDAIVAIILRLAPTIIVSAGAGVIITELGRYTFMLSDVLREKTDKWIAKKREEERQKERARGRAEGRAQGQAEARAESQAEARAQGQAEGRAESQAEARAQERAEIRELLQDWNARRLASQANGQPFDEPPPTLD